MCDFAANWCSKSNSSRDHAPASSVIFNTAAKGGNRKAGDKGQTRNKGTKLDRKVNCWNCVGNHFTRDCNKPAKKDGVKKGNVNVTFIDN